MPTIDKANGIVIPRRIGEALAAGVTAARAEFGFGVMNPANPIREIVEALGALPWDAREQDIVDLAVQFDPRVSKGQFLQAALWPLFRPEPAKASAGIVHLHYKSIVTSPDPVFSASDLEFTDGAGLRYVGTDDLSPPATIHDTSAQTGIASETIGSGTGRIAQQVAITDNEFPQSVRLGGLAAIAGTPLATVRVETDSAGSPSGILADAALQIVGQALAAGQNDFVFTKGAILATGTYWVVLLVSGGTLTFDGGAGGPTNRTKVYGSSWTASANVENLNLKLYNGGLFPVVATQLGATGNVEPNSIGYYRANNDAALTLFGNLVSSFANLKAFEGGQDPEGDETLRTRARVESSARGTSSPPGIIHGMKDGTVPGVVFVDILENDTMDWGEDQPVLNNSAKTGSQSEDIDGFVQQRIAQRFTTDGYGSISAIAVKLAVNNSAELTVRVETDSMGQPSGILASPKFEKMLVTPPGTARYLFTLDKADFLPAGTYWLVVFPTSGDFRLTGTTTGTDANVHIYNGAWSSSTLKDMNVEIYGGVPPKSWEPFIEGGSDDDVAQGLYDLGPPGIPPYGNQIGNARDLSNRSVIRLFSRPTSIDAVFHVELRITSLFAGDASTIRALIAEYVAELGIGDALVRQEAMARLMTGDSRTIGIFDITAFLLGKKVAYPTPSSLTGAQVANLTTDHFGDRFRVANPTVDIEVILTTV